MGYLNPLLSLPAAQGLMQMPPGVRDRLEGLFREIRAHANLEAEAAWDKRKGSASGFTPFSTEASAQLTQASPLLTLAAVQAILQMPIGVRSVLERLFRQIRTHANDEAETAWARRKAPMAVYWLWVANFSRLIAHTLRKGMPISGAVATVTVTTDQALHWRWIATISRHIAHALSKGTGQDAPVNFI